MSKDDEHRLMIDVSRGILDIYQNFKEIRPNVIIADFPLNGLFRNGKII